MKRTFFITGTDTGVGKTLLTVLLAEFMRSRGVRVAALKPICSGDREDARRLQAALAGAMTLDEINPWHFRKAIAPEVAAKLERKAVKLEDVLKHIYLIQNSFDVLLIEGAGGVLSPLGSGFNSRDLIYALNATPVVVASNKLGVVNHLLLTVEALGERLRSESQVVLMTPPKPDSATPSNLGLLRKLSVRNVNELPWFGGRFAAQTVLAKKPVQKTLAAVAESGAPVRAAKTRLTK